MSKLYVFFIALLSIGNLEASTVKVNKCKLLTMNSSSVKVSLILGCDGNKDDKPDVLAHGGVTEVCYDGCTVMRKFIITGAKGKSVSIKLHSESEYRSVFITSFSNFSGKYEIINGKTCDIFADSGGYFIEVSVDGSIVHKSEIVGIGCM
ncbi:MAG: hypothetical protein ACK49C_08230 [Ignavibacteria bacterium]|jgi:hypothetical protein